MSYHEYMFRLYVQHRGDQPANRFNEICTQCGACDKQLYVCRVGTGATVYKVAGDLPIACRHTKTERGTYV